MTVAEPGALRPVGGDHFRVFTPYWNRWRMLPLRPLAPRPLRIVVPADLARGAVPQFSEVAAAAASPQVIRGGETVGRARLEAWCPDGLARYPEQHDLPAIEGTSRLSPYLHFGCLSSVAVMSRCRSLGDSETFLRQLCWRDFHHQVTRAFPAITRDEYRRRGHRWADNADLLAAWKAGRTGYPFVDAGMRQLAAEGWMHNRARLVTASFLVKDLGLDWRLGAQHFLDLLVDGDIANNAGNWQWVAGTGNDTRPNRIFNPVRQALRLDPEGAYVRRWVPELAVVSGARIHTPWRLGAAERARLDYCSPLVDHDAAATAFRRRGSA